MHLVHHNKPPAAPDTDKEPTLMLEEVSLFIKHAWQQIATRHQINDSRADSLPVNTLRYRDELSPVFESSYNNCPVAEEHKQPLKQMEIDCYALQAAINARELLLYPDELEQIKPILVALRILCKEFKEDRMQDGEYRFASFLRQLHKLTKELTEHIRTDGAP